MAASSSTVGHQRSSPKASMRWDHPNGEAHTRALSSIAPTPRTRYPTATAAPASPSAPRAEVDTCTATSVTAV